MGMRSERGSRPGLQQGILKRHGSDAPSMAFIRAPLMISAAKTSARFVLKITTARPATPPARKIIAAAGPPMHCASLVIRIWQSAAAIWKLATMAFVATGDRANSCHKKSGWNL